MPDLATVDVAEPTVRRPAPDPGIALPRVAVPTVLVWVVSALVWVAATVLALRVTSGAASPWWLLLTVPAHTAVTFSMFTVLHEAVHHAAGRLDWVNEWLGRLAMPFVAVWGTFPMIRYLHIEHHRNTNEDIATDPDAWTEAGPLWQLPFRWLVMDVWYFRFYLPRLPRRPRREQVGFVVNLSLVALAIAALVTAGYGVELLAVYLVPQRLGVGLLAWWFDWLPHHDLETTAKTDRFRATRVRVGWERVMTPLMFSQNYHLVHHVHPAIPFYRYVQAWRNTEDDYLERQAPIATAWGRSLTAEEYREWRAVTDGLDGETRGPDAPRARLHRLTVADVRPLTPDAVSLTCHVPDALRETFRFRAGQHVAVEATVDGERVRRTYSLCSTPNSGVLRIGVKRVDRGRLSTHLAQHVQPGDELDVLAPSGAFVLTDPPELPRRLAAVAAGSGITPVLSVLATALTAEPDTQATLVYANRNTTSTMFAEELDQLVLELEGRLRIVHVHSQPDPTPPAPRLNQRVLTGRLDSALLARLLDERHDGDPLWDADEWYVCGPQPLTDVVVEHLRTRGVGPERVHRELFVTAAPQTRATATVDADVLLTLDGRTRQLRTAGDETVLEAALRSGVDAPYSCAGGACGTCKAKLLLGNVDMQQNHVLSETELDAGWVLTCQSRPTTPRVQVDYDAG